MGYYRGGMGDYYSGRGDFFSRAKKKLKRALPKLGRLMPASAAMLPSSGGIGGAIGTLQYGAPGMSAGAGGLMGSLGGFLGEKFGIGAAAGSTITAALLGGSSDLPGDSPWIPDIVEVPLEAAGLNELRGRKRRTLNPANVSALRRALRRVDSFRNLAKKSGAMPAARRLPAQRASKCCK